MIAKEKAKQLFDRFYQEAPLDEIEFYNNDVMAKSCALIAVDEMLEMIDKDEIDVWDRNILIYWKEVKQEILSL